ncbi:MAG: hypothetical protein ACPGSG_08300 [Prolixibacteraceae bacterium]
MGKLKDLLDQYKQAPINSPRERELKEEIQKIVDWMKENNIGKEFKWPKKYGKRKLFGFYPSDGWRYVGNFIVHEDNLEETISLLSNKNSNK